MNETTVSRSRLVLRANAAFSTIGGLVAVVAAGWLSDVSGIDHVTIQIEPAGFAEQETLCEAGAT